MFDMNAPDDEATRFADMFDLFGVAVPDDTLDDVGVPAPQGSDTPDITPATPTTQTAPSATAAVVTVAAATVVAGAVTAAVTAANSTTSPASTTTTDATEANVSQSSATQSESKTEESVEASNPTRRQGPSRWIAAGIIAGVTFSVAQAHLPDISALTDVETVDVAAPQMLTAEGASGTTVTIPADVSSAFDEQITDAKRYQQVAGSFTGWRPNTPMLGASGGPYLVLVLVSDGVCYSTGIAPGYDDSVSIDPAGTRCNPSSINDLQRKLDTIG